MRPTKCALVLGLVIAASSLTHAGMPYTSDFLIDECGGFSNHGSHPFFILEPGYQLVLEGREDGKTERVRITVLNEIEVVDGVPTRVVEEYETEDGEVVEISRNYMAICNRDNSIFYFGEDSVDYEDGEPNGTEGSWRAGVDGARAGIIMPGTVLLGARHFQEIAPDVAMDRSRIVSLNKEVVTPAGTFTGCLKAIDTNPLSPGEEDPKWYARGIGLVRDEDLKLISYGQAP